MGKTCEIQPSFLSFFIKNEFFNEAMPSRVSVVVCVCAFSLFKFELCRVNTLQKMVCNLNLEIAIIRNRHG